MIKSPRRGFTLMELLVVIGIIIIMTGLSIPAVKKFMDGQKLSQSGRILQSAFNEARRAAITQRTKQYLLFYKEVDDEGLLRYGLVRYRDRFGFEGDAHKLLPHVEIDSDEYGSAALSGSSPHAALFTSRSVGLRLPIFNGVPPQNDTIFQSNKLSPDTTLTTVGWIEFSRDGTIGLLDLTQNLPVPGTQAATVFDLNQFLESVPDATAGLVDINLRETGRTDVDKRCFIDIDPNTGRLRFRVVQCVAGS